jgi:anti-sigma factor RsiW
MSFCDNDAMKLDYINGELSGAARDRMIRHLESCPGCREELDDLAGLARALESLPRQPVPRDLVDRVERAVLQPALVPARRADRNQLHSWGSFVASAMTVVAAAAVLLVLPDPALTFLRSLPGLLDALVTSAQALNESTRAALVCMWIAIAFLCLPACAESLHVLLVLRRARRNEGCRSARGPGTTETTY